jgi:hypothetical protein
MHPHDRFERCLVSLRTELNAVWSFGVGQRRLWKEHCFLDIDSEYWMIPCFLIHLITSRL